MFWDSYAVQPIVGHLETLTEQFRLPDCHHLRNIAFPEYRVNAFGNMDPTTNRVTLRLAYIKLEETRWEAIKRILFRWLCYC